MPWQAQLFIGVSVHSWTEARSVLDRLGVSHASVDDDDLFHMPDEQCRKTEVVFRGTRFTVVIAPQREREGDTPFPVPDAESYTDAIVGFPLTSRYSPAILDQGYEHGRPEPFVIDLDAARAILDEVHAFWPEAQCMMWDKFY